MTCRRTIPAPPRLAPVRRLKAACGVTLLELLTTLAVLAICLALGLPAYERFLQRQRADAAAHLLTSYFATARLTAVTHRKITVVCPSDGSTGACLPDRDWGQGWMLFLAPNGGRQPSIPEHILRNEPAPLHPSLRMVSNQGRPQLRYLPDGRSSGSNLTVRVCQDTRVLAEVIVNNAGRIRTTRPDNPEGCPR